MGTRGADRPPRRRALRRGVPGRRFRVVAEAPVHSAPGAREAGNRDGRAWACRLDDENK